MQPGYEPEGLFGLGPCSCEESPMQKQRLDHKQHQREQEPHSHHRVHPPIRDQKEAIPQIEPREHVEAREPSQRCCEARLPAETPLDDLEKGDPLLRDFEISYRGHQYRRDECHAPDPQDDGEDMERSSNRYVIHWTGPTCPAPSPRRPITSFNLSPLGLDAPEPSEGVRDA